MLGSRFAQEILESIPVRCTQCGVKVSRNLPHDDNCPLMVAEAAQKARQKPAQEAAIGRVMVVYGCVFAVLMAIFGIWLWSQS